MAGANKNTRKLIKSISEFMEWVDALQGELLLYRGLASSEYELQSSAERRVGQLNAVPAYVDNLLDRAKRRRLHYRVDGKLTDLELFAELQHSGAATFLIDFTENSLVALWFACQSDQGTPTNGKLIAMPTEDVSRFQVVTGDRIDNEIGEFFAEEKLWNWTPPNQNNRILPQRSVFIFGSDNIREDDYQSIEIAHAKKQNLLDELDKKFGINEEYLFSDLNGFASANAHNKIYRPDSAIGNFYVALGHHQRGELNVAIDYYDKAINLDPHYAAAYYNRGIAKGVLGNYTEAITDYSQTIKLRPKFADAYHNRGNAKVNLDEREAAIADYSEAINLNPLYASAYHSRGIAKYTLGNYAEAIADYSQAIGLNPQHALTYYNRGDAKQQSGDVEGAQLDYEQSYKLDPSLRPTEDKRS